MAWHMMFFNFIFATSLARKHVQKLSSFSNVGQSHDNSFRFYQSDYFLKTEKHKNLYELLHD